MMQIEELGRLLVGAMPDALLVSDAEGTIHFWNGGAERIFGFTSNEAMGRSLDLIIPEPLRERHWAGYHRTMRTGRTRYAAGDLLSVPALTRDGRRISVQFSIMPIPASGAGLRAVAAIMRDVTAEFEERKQLKKQLRHHGPENAANPADGDRQSMPRPKDRDLANRHLTLRTVSPRRLSAKIPPCFQTLWPGS